MNDQDAPDRTRARAEAQSGDLWGLLFSLHRGRREEGLGELVLGD